MMHPPALALMQRQREFASFQKLTEDPRALLRVMDAEGIERLVAINYVSPQVIGFTEEVNQWVVDYCRAEPERLLPCGSLDPRRTADPAGDIERLYESGIRLLKIHPPHQLLYPNDYQNGVTGLADIYRACERIGLPVMIHTGTSVFPGARNRYGDPLFIDDVAVDFPALKILVAHGGRPLWMQNAMFVVRRHPNVYLEVSSIPPRRLLDYFPRLGDLAPKTIFGSDWPGPGVPGMGANVRDFLALPLPPHAQRLILRSNALKLLWNKSD